MSCKFILSILSSVLSARVIASLPQPLPQDITNGGSNLGTLDAPYLPDFLTSNPLPDGFPWGNRNGQNDPFCDPPNTGVTRYYDFTVARGHLLSDGFNKSGIYVNGQFPGPAIEANWGDWIEVRVHNNITGPEEGTSLHWHGILQKGTQWYDGVPGVTQCPIAPGSSFTYRFRADVYGTSWWHSHFSAQYTMGVFGPLTVYGPKYEEYDIDVGPVMLGTTSTAQTLHPVSIAFRMLVFLNSAFNLERSTVYD
ncbi:similar to laccase-1 precursor [Neofusicoccum parvum]|nr:similar to laccase-1 precursor [Neofusicoccum parvum]